MMAIGSAYAATQMSMLKNLSILSDMAAVDKSFENAGNKFLDVVSNAATGLVPFSGASRELERYVFGDLSRPQNTVNRLLQNIPFVKFVSDAKPALNVFGEPVRPSVLPGIGRFFGEATNSFEMDWLLRNGYSFTLPKANGALTKAQQERYTDMLQSDDPENFEPYLTDDDQRSYMETLGPLLKATINQYAKSNPQGFDQDVQDDLNKDIRRLKKIVKEEILTQ